MKAGLEKKVEEKDSETAEEAVSTGTGLIEKETQREIGEVGLW